MKQLIFGEGMKKIQKECYHFQQPSNNNNQHSYTKKYRKTVEKK